MSAENSLTIEQNKLYTGERALFRVSDMQIEHGVFRDGESPLKHARNLIIRDSVFGWKYPLWYADGIRVENSVWLEEARAGVWYTNNIRVEGCTIQAPKNFRRARDIKLTDVLFSGAKETLWHCSDVEMSRVEVAGGDYFAMDSDNLRVDGLRLDGRYCFDSCRNLEISNSTLVTKDAFWNCENVVARNCFITGEYLGWNSRNLTFIDCTIDSLQGLCYIDNLIMRGCRLLQTNYAFEYSTLDADIPGRVESVLNPDAGTLRAGEIGDLILDGDHKDRAGLDIEADRIEKESSEAQW